MLSRVDSTHLVDAMAALPEAEARRVERVFEQHDRDRDGAISFAEFTQVTLPLPLILTLTLTPTLTLTLTPTLALPLLLPLTLTFHPHQVMEEVTQRGGKPCSQQKLKQMFAAADLNHNGVVDFNEFCVLQQKKEEKKRRSSRSRRSSPSPSVAGDARSVASDDTPRSWPGSVDSTPRTWPTPPMTPREPLDSPSAMGSVSSRSDGTDGTEGTWRASQYGSRPPSTDGDGSSPSHHHASQAGLAAAWPSATLLFSSAAASQYVGGGGGGGGGGGCASGGPSQYASGAPSERSGGGSVSGSHSTACSGQPLYMHGAAHSSPPLLMPPGTGTLPPLGSTLQGLQGGAALHGLQGPPHDYGALAQPIDLGMARPLALTQPLALAAADGAWARLVSEGGGGAADGAAPLTAVLLRESTHVLGRSKSCRTVLAHSRVSAQHCVIYRGQGQSASSVQLDDLSRYGTFVNGVLVGKGQSAPLRHGDQLALVSTSAVDGILFRVELVDRAALLAAPAPPPTGYLPPPPHIARRPSGGSVAGSVTSCGSGCDPSFSWPAELMGDHMGAAPLPAASPHAAPLPLGMGGGAQYGTHGMPAAAALPRYMGGGPGAPPMPSQQYGNPNQASQQYVSAAAAGRAPPPGPPPGCAMGMPAAMPPAPLPPPAPPPQSAAMPWTLTPPSGYGAPVASHYPPPAMPPLPLGVGGAAEGVEAPQSGVGGTLRRPPRAPGSTGAAGVAPPPRDVSQEEAWLRLHAMQVEASRAGSTVSPSAEDERRARKPVLAPLYT